MIALEIPSASHQEPTRLTLLSLHLHYSTDKHAEVISLIKSHKMLAGLAISPLTPSSVLTPEIVSTLDLILVMTVTPGKGGQKFMPECLEKVKELREKYGNEIHIEVDGGVGTGNACACAEAGANVFVGGTSIFGAEKPREVIQEMKKAIDEAVAKRA